MKEHFNNKTNILDKEMISVMDELPLWSAPFGLKLLNRIKMGKNLKVLDIGSGFGFPLIEIAQRLGDSSLVYGIDPWAAANGRTKLKIKKYELKNAVVIESKAEKMPFENSFFDIIISNNGINNVGDLGKTLSECKRILKKGGQFLFTMNLDGSMLEFYNMLKSELEKISDNESIVRLKEHIYLKRKPLDEIKQRLNENGFVIKEIDEDKFYLRFAGGTALFNHSFIKYWFLDSWKKIVNKNDVERIFENIERKLNKLADGNGEVRLTIPYATIDCEKN